MKFAGDMEPYRVGLGRDLWRLHHSDYRWQVVKMAVRSMRRRSWWGLWQVEWPGCSRAVRGFTANHAYRRAVRKQIGRAHV